MSKRHQPVLSGLEVLVRQRFASLQGARVGLITNPSAVDRRLVSAQTHFQNNRTCRLAALFSPEHGLEAAAPYLAPVRGQRGKVPVYSLYGRTAASLKPRREMLHRLDVLVFDLQDVGARYYTYAATLLYVMTAAAEAGLPVVVLDRPNPLGGLAVEGGPIQPGYRSFVGMLNVPQRHGLTIGELALWAVDELGLAVDLSVIHCQGWRRAMDFHATGLPWVMPSPNMPTLDTAWVYPGMCLLEGANVSEGRGATRPFELFGAPWLDRNQVAAALASYRLPGVIFRPVGFTPLFDKHAGRRCQGAQLHVTDRRTFRPLLTGLAVLCVLRRLSGRRLTWRREAYEFVHDKPAIDLLAGGPDLRQLVDGGAAPREIAARWRSFARVFRRRRREYLIYE